MKKIFVTFAENIEKKILDSKGKPTGETKTLVTAGQRLPMSGDASLGVIALLEYGPGGNTQTTDPAKEFADKDNNRASIRACLGMKQNGYPADVFELEIDGTVYRRATRESLVRCLELCEQMNELKREMYTKVERIADLPKIGKKERVEGEEPEFQVI